MSGHGGHESHGADHGHGGGGGKESIWEKIPLAGKMLKEIAGVEGIKNFLNDMVEHHVLPVAMKVFDPIAEFFGGGGGGGGHAHAHAH